MTRGGPLSLQVQLAETEAFSLNSDRSSSILLGDDLSLEDPAACPVGPRDSKVSTVGSWAGGSELAAWPLPAMLGHCPFLAHHLSGTCCMLGPHLLLVR